MSFAIYNFNADFTWPRKIVVRGVNKTHRSENMSLTSFLQQKKTPITFAFKYKMFVKLLERPTCDRVHTPCHALPKNVLIWIKLLINFVWVCDLPNVSHRASWVDRCELSHSDRTILGRRFCLAHCMVFYGWIERLRWIGSLCWNCIVSCGLFFGSWRIWEMS